MRRNDLISTNVEEQVEANEIFSDNINGGVQDEDNDENVIPDENEENTNNKKKA